MGEDKATILNLFRKAVRQATCEEDIHSFLKTNDVLRKSFGYRWAFSKFPLGSEFVTDFVLVQAFSEGLHVFALELENPNYDSAFTKSGRMGCALASAVSQVGDWAQWIRQNEALFLKTLRVAIKRDYMEDWSSLPRHRFYALSALRFGLVVGRRTDEESDAVAALKRKYQGLMPEISIMSYDRLIEMMGRGSIY